MKTIRASQVPLLFRCGQSAQPCDLPIQDHSPAADLGTLTHFLIAEWLRLVRPDPEGDEFFHQVRMEAVARFGDEHLVEALELFERARGHVPDLSANYRMEIESGLAIDGNLFIPAMDFHVTGRPDLAYYPEADWEKDRLTIIDWKTGRRDSDYTFQMMAYAFLALNHLIDLYGFTRLPDVIARVVWLRDGRVDEVQITSKQINAFLDRLVDVMAVENPEYVTGDHCTFCRRRRTCPAYENMKMEARCDMACVTPTRAGEPAQRDIRDLSTGDLSKLWHMAGALDENIKRFRREVKQDVLERGPLPLGDGMELAVADVKTRKVDPVKAWPVLQHELTPEQHIDCTTISAAKAEAFAGQNAKAGGGKVKAGKEGMKATLAEAGAVQYQVRQTLKIRKATKGEIDHDECAHMA